MKQKIRCEHGLQQRYQMCGLSETSSSKQTCLLLPQTFTIKKSLADFGIPLSFRQVLTL